MVSGFRMGFMGPTLAAALVLLLACSQVSTARQCEVDNAALRAMQRGVVQFTFADAQQFELSVKVANNNLTRAAGFQKVCEATIAAEPILFLFERETRPSFHMNNVVAPIDIAFIDGRGRIDSIHAMQPYVLGSNSRPLYSPEGLVVAALEVQPGFYSEHHIDQTVTVRWRAMVE